MFFIGLILGLIVGSFLTARAGISLSTRKGMRFVGAIFLPEQKADELNMFVKEKRWGLRNYLATSLAHAELIFDQLERGGKFYVQSGRGLTPVEFCLPSLEDRQATNKRHLYLVPPPPDQDPPPTTKQ